MKDRMTICLWFDGGAEDAAAFYAAAFPDCTTGAVQRAPMDYPAGKAGDVLTVAFTLLGQDFMCLNAGGTHRFNAAVSFQIFTDDQAETDRLWAAITADGGSESMCGWCKDRFGISWQIIPRRLTEIMTSPDRAAAQRGMAAMMTMGKIDIAALDAAYDGNNA